MPRARLLQPVAGSRTTSCSSPGPSLAALDPSDDASSVPDSEPAFDSSPGSGCASPRRRGESARTPSRDPHASVHVRNNTATASSSDATTAAVTVLVVYSSAATLYVDMTARRRRSNSAAPMTPSPSKYGSACHGRPWMPVSGHAVHRHHQWLPQSDLQRCEPICTGRHAWKLREAGHKVCQAAVRLSTPHGLQCSGGASAAHLAAVASAERHRSRGARTPADTKCAPGASKPSRLEAAPTSTASSRCQARTARVE